MIGVSLSFDWLCGAPHPLGNVAEVLDGLKRRGVESVELRAVCPHHTAKQVARAAGLLWDHGFQVTVHASPTSCETAVDDVFAPLTELFAHLRQECVTITLHPLVGDNAAMLMSLADCAESRGYPVVLALENNRLLPDKTEGDSAVLVLEAVETVDRPNVGICFDMGHYLYYLKQNCPDKLDRLPGKNFFKRVVHTHIHALKDKKTHFPLGTFDLPLDPLLEALCHEYFGVYNIELDFPRFAKLCEPRKALFGSVDVLRDAMPYCARLYDDIRRNFDRRFLNALDALSEPRQGTRFALIQSSAYLFQTNGCRWAMDVAFRNAYRLTKTPSLVASLLAGLDLMVISHGHSDHFEECTIRALAQTEMRWVIPDCLVERALSYGLREEKVLVARAGETLQVCGLTILPFRGRHFRPVTSKGTDEYGYHISAPDAPSMAFPVDVRDFSLDGLPLLPPADVCFANVWLGDKNGFAADYGDRLEEYVRFMLHFSDKNILFTHLYENGRRNADMWRVEHAELLSDAVHALSPETCTAVPNPGEIFEWKY